MWFAPGTKLRPARSGTDEGVELAYYVPVLDRIEAAPDGMGPAQSRSSARRALHDLLPRYAITSIPTSRREILVLISCSRWPSSSKSSNSVRIARSSPGTAGSAMVPGNHLHLIVEADTREILTKGMQAFAIVAARTINRAAKRRGKVFAYRYHATPIATPKQMRNTLVYVLNNWRKHGEDRRRGCSGFAPENDKPGRGWLSRRGRRFPLLDDKYWC